MSKDLPLWEDDESDVKVEYRLQFGHALVSTTDIEQVLEKLRSIFKLGRPVSISNTVNVKKLPRDKKTGATILDEDNYWHFILANIESNIAIFAPHMLFHNSSNWIKLSRKIKAQLAFVKQIDSDSYYYYIFIKGKHICNAAKDQSGIHESVMEPVEAYLNGKLIYKTKEKKANLLNICTILFQMTYLLMLKTVNKYDLLHHYRKMKFKRHWQLGM